MKRCLLLTLIVGLFVSCSRTATLAPKATPAQKFDSEHGGKTITPHGRVTPGSARDLPGGWVEYKTEDGSNFRIHPNPNGSYPTPERAPTVPQ